MSEDNNFWKALHEKRSGKKKNRVSSKTQGNAAPRATERAPISRNTTTRAPNAFELTPPKPLSRTFPRQPGDFQEPKRGSSVSRRVSRGGKARFTVTIDMVSDDNRESVRAAARSEGRTLSQWARRVLLSAADPSNRE